MGDLSAKVYLIYTYALFHIVSILRGKSGEVFLNQMNTLSFYALYTLTQPAFGMPGTFEFLIAGIQLGSLLLYKSIHSDESDTPSSYGLLLLTLLFMGIGTLRYFEGMTLPTVLTAEALLTGFLSLRGHYRSILTGVSYVLFFFAICQLFPVWSSLSDSTLILTVGWMMIAGVLLEAMPFRHHENVGRGALLGICTILFLSALLSAMPSQWRTISMISTGFIFLATGFCARRKLYRWLGLGWIFLIGGFSILGDMAHLSMGYKILLFILLGVGLLGGSYGYSLMQKHLKDQESSQDSTHLKP